jgi:hypothetical protein
LPVLFCFYSVYLSDQARGFMAVTLGFVFFAGVISIFADALLLPTETFGRPLHFTVDRALSVWLFHGCLAA